MAKYGIEKEVTIHVKGMSFADSSAASGGGDRLVIGLDTRVGEYDKWVVVDTDEWFSVNCVLFHENNKPDKISTLDSIASNLCRMKFIYESIGGDNGKIHELASQVGYSGLDSDLVDMILSYESKLRTNDTVCYMPEIDRIAFTVVSKAALPYVAAEFMIESGDERTFDELVAEVSENMESDIQWLPDYHTYFIAPRLNKEGMINLYRERANLERIDSAS